MELVYPLPQDRGWSDNNHGLMELLAVMQGGNERYQLD